MIATVCNKIHPTVWHFVAINYVFCYFSTSMRDTFDWRAGFCSNSSSLLVLCNILCAFSNTYLCCKLSPNCFLQLCGLLLNNTTQFVNFYSLPSLLFVHIFKYVPLPDLVGFFYKSCSLPSSACMIFPRTRSLVCYLEPINCFMSYCLIFRLHYYPLPQCFHRWSSSLFRNSSLILRLHYLWQLLL